MNKKTLYLCLNDCNIKKKKKNEYLLLRDIENILLLLKVYIKILVITFGIKYYVLFFENKYKIILY